MARPSTARNTRLETAKAVINSTPTRVARAPEPRLHEFGPRSDSRGDSRGSAPSQNAYSRVPPSTWMTTPVTNEASGDARKVITAASSSGRPARPTGINSPMRSSRDSPGGKSRSVCADSVKPGPTQLMVTPYLATLVDIDFDQMCKLALAALAALIVSGSLFPT